MMKITRRQLKRIIAEELATQPVLFEWGENWEELADEEEMEPELKTVGDLRKLIKVMQSEKRAKKGIEGIKDMGTGLLADLFPLGGTIQTAGETLFNMYKQPDEKKTSTMLDKLNVDDEIAAIVDDTVEDNFLKQAVDALDAYGDDEDIPDINQELSDWLQSAYDQRTVAGFEEGKKMKITKRQLRRTIKETLVREGAEEKVAAYYEQAEHYDGEDALYDLLDRLVPADAAAMDLESIDDIEHYEMGLWDVIDMLTPEIVARIAPDLEIVDMG